MPIIKSAKKRTRIAKKATARNVRTKRSFRSAVKTLATKPTLDALRQAQSTIDTAVKKGVLHKNTAARKKKQLAAQAKAAGVKITAKKPATPKPAAKKTAVKKPAAKATKKTLKKSAKK